MLPRDLVYMVAMPGHRDLSYVQYAINTWEPFVHPALGRRSI
jgi:hypothetical protein